jgi:hypothetical protein
MRVFQSQVKKSVFVTDPNGPFGKWTFLKQNQAKKTYKRRKDTIVHFF